MQFRGTSGMFDFAIGHGGRASKGTEITIKVDPVIEEFVRGLGDGTSRLLQSGSLWYSIDPEKTEAYAFGNGEIPAPEFDGYALDMLNKPFVVESQNQGPQQPGGNIYAQTPGDVVNLSFLRLKGIGSNQGVKFGMRLIYSPSAMDHIKARVGRACRQLCRDYIVPVQMRLVIVNEE